MHEKTGTRDVTYDLISVLYHSLQAAEICCTYANDAKEEGQRELADFFEKVIAQNREIATRCKDFLRARLGETANGSKDESLIDKASADSFPASDSPAVY